MDVGILLGLRPNFGTKEQEEILQLLRGPACRGGVFRTDRPNEDLKVLV